MKIRSMRIVNYKSFYDTGDIQLSPYINVVVGANNSGKSAFLEGFVINSKQNKPHRSADLQSDEIGEQRSFSQYELVFSGEEIRRFLKNTGSSINYYTNQIDPVRANQQAIEFMTEREVVGRVEVSPGSAPIKRGDQKYLYGLSSPDGQFHSVRISVSKSNDLSIVMLGSGANDNVIKNISGSL